MEKTFKVINDLEKEGVIEKYALGGATALLFYAEPQNTWDVDVFVFLPGMGDIIDLTPLAQTLKKKGYMWEKAQEVMIEGVPVHFLVPPLGLVEEGVKEAAIHMYRDVQVKVIRIEHLLAIMLETNLPRHRERIAGLLEKKVKFDEEKLQAILTKHHLKEKWERAIEKPK